MMDPAEAADNVVSWAERQSFKLGFFLGFLTACLLVWMAG
jgi:hypothetical protein